MRLSPGAFVVVLFRFEAGALIVICCRLYFQIFWLEPVGEYAARLCSGESNLPVKGTDLSANNFLMKLEVVQIFIDYQVGEKKKKHPILLFLQNRVINLYLVDY